MLSIRRRLAIIGSVAALGAGLGALGTAPVAVAKTCSSGYTHGVISGAEKCLRRGEYCARAADAQYRYGYRCIKRDANGAYHLT